MNANQLRKGMLILHEGAPHRILEFLHRTPGKGRALVQVKLRNLATGVSYEVRFGATEDVERARLEQHEMEYLYGEGNLHHFMNTETYEQMPLDSETLGDALNYMLPGITIQVEFFEGKPMGVELPSSVELEVVETEPELRGATASASYKPARLETGVMIQVPPFIKEGDKVRVNPNEGTYLERVK